MTDVLDTNISVLEEACMEVDHVLERKLVSPLVHHQILTLPSPEQSALAT